MRSIENIKEHLNRLLPYPPSEALVSDIFYCCSSITFDKIGENLFRKGDSPKGFYWILQGKVNLRLAGKEDYMISEGNFVGMDNFVSHKVHHFDIVSVNQKVETLFIDRKCYTNIFLKHTSLATFVLQKHLNQLLELKNSIGTREVA